MRSKLHQRLISRRKPRWTFEDSALVFLILRILLRIEHGFHLDVLRRRRTMARHRAEQSLVVNTSSRVKSHARHASSKVNP